MVTTIPNAIPPEQYEAMAARVLKMNTGIEDFIRNEMMDHKRNYDPVTGARYTAFDAPYGSFYQRVPLVAPDGALVNCELLMSCNPTPGAVLYIHGAAFMRRTNDLNLKTADRLCWMTGNLVCVPDYRIGIPYTYSQMVMDVIVGYRYLLEEKGYKPEQITMMADSSGCVTALQAVREMGNLGISAPGKIILWSPPAKERCDREKVNQGKERDLAFSTNDLLYISNNTYFEGMCKGMNAEEVYPIYGEFSVLKNSLVYIQTGGAEMLTEDAYMLHDLLANICPCMLEVYDDMYHNFQTYFSICDMARVCWEKIVRFIANVE